MFSNGIILQSCDVLPYMDQRLIKAQNYRGIYSGITWPLDTNGGFKIEKHFRQSF